MKAEQPSTEALDALRTVLDRRPGVYRDLADATDFGAYLDNGARHRQKLMPADLLAAQVPRDVARFKADVESAQAAVASLLSQGRSLVEAAERLVCVLYAVPSELEDEVVAHAASRAKAAAGGSV